MKIFEAPNRKSIADANAVDTLLNRNVEEVFVREELRKKLLSGRPLRVKLGFDPTSSQIHIGRAITLWKLRELQDLGHEAIFILGDFTARIGDPSDKLSKRPMLTDKEIENNVKTYKEQVAKIVDIKKAEFHFNSLWLSKMPMKEMVALAESFSIQQMSGRRNFKERFRRGDEVSLREFLYPLFQGYDSVAIKADVEIGGFDQLFNLKAGRTVQRHFGMTEQDVLTTKMLLGTDGRKMSSSWGNIINITDQPKEMFGKIMSLRDNLIGDYFTLCTEISEVESLKISAALQDGKTNPRDLKLELAEKIVARYWGESKAKDAGLEFEKVFGKGGSPQEIATVEVKKGTLLYEIVFNNRMVSSKSEWQRLVKSGAVDYVGGGEVTDYKATADSSGDLRIGKKRFLRIVVK